MKFVFSLVLMGCLSTLTTTARAETTVRLEHGTLLHWEYPQQQPWEILSCLAAGHPVLGEEFASNYPVADIWIDDVSLVGQGNGLTYTARLSAPIDGRWHHRVYQMSTNYSHSCTAGSPVLLNESVD